MKNHQDSQPEGAASNKVAKLVAASSLAFSLAAAGHGDGADNDEDEDVSAVSGAGSASAGASSASSAGSALDAASDETIHESQIISGLLLVRCCGACEELLALLMMALCDFCLFLCSSLIIMHLHGM